jgi:threonine dehydrogenase-like Zn-dependent dehydrogenase
VTVVGRDDDRLRIAQADAAIAEWSFPDHDVEPWDVVIEASGAALAAQLGARRCRDGGVVALAGAYPADGHVSLSQLTQHNLRVEGVNTGRGGWTTALKNLTDGTISSRMLQPAVVGVEDAPTKIVEMLESTKRPLKLILRYPGGTDATTDARAVSGAFG